MSKPRRYITLRWLRTHEACLLAQEAFIEKWGRTGKPTVYEVAKACWRGERDEWALWFLDCVLQDDLYAAWKAAWPGVYGDAAMRRLDYKYARLHMEQCDER